MTTTTFFPDPDAESTSVDGRVYRAVTNESWATIHDNADGTAFDDPSAELNAISVISDTTSYEVIVRSFYLFDTSSIPDGDDISTATLSLWSSDDAGSS